MKPLPAEELREEQRRFLQLLERPAVVAALRTFVESQDAMPYLPRGS